jgi:hypothetical protein
MRETGLMLSIHMVSLQMWTELFGDPPHKNKTTGWSELERGNNISPVLFHFFTVGQKKVPEN